MEICKGARTLAGARAVSLENEGLQWPNVMTTPLRSAPARRGGGGARERGFLARVAVAMGPVRRGKGRGARPPGARRTAKAGRGAVAAAFAADGLGPRSRRVIVKARLVRVRGGSPRALTKHLQYLEREGVTPAGDPGRAYDASTDAADVRAFDAAHPPGRLPVPVHRLTGRRHQAG